MRDDTGRGEITARPHLSVPLREKLRVETGLLIRRAVKRPRCPGGDPKGALHHAGEHDHPGGGIRLTVLLCEKLRPDSFGGGQGLGCALNPIIILRANRLAFSHRCATAAGQQRRHVIPVKYRKASTARNSTIPIRLAHRSTSTLRRDLISLRRIVRPSAPAFHPKMQHQSVPACSHKQDRNSR